MASVATVQAQVQLAASLLLLLGQAHAGPSDGLGGIRLAALGQGQAQAAGGVAGAAGGLGGEADEAALDVDAEADEVVEVGGNLGAAAQLLVDLLVEALKELINQRTLIPIQILGNRLEDASVLGNGSCALAQTSDLAFGGFASLRVFKDVLQLQHKGAVVVHQVIASLQLGSGPAGGSAVQHARHEAHAGAINAEISGALLHEDLALGDERSQCVRVAVKLLRKVLQAVFIQEK